MKQRGFSLVELMVTLLLGLVISSGIIQIMVSSRTTNSLNQSISQVQESGRFIMTRLSRELLEVGRYDPLIMKVDTSVDTLVESAFIQNRPVALAGDFAAEASLGTSQGANGANDELVVNLLSTRDCTGNRFGYPSNVSFHVVNHYYVIDSRLYCRGYDGRELRGVKPAQGTRQAVILMDNVESFQLQFGITEVISDSQGQAVRYVTGELLPALRADNRQVVALRIGVLLQSDDGLVSTISAQRYAVLNEPVITTDTRHYFQVFSQTYTLRNMKNFVRGVL